ncbi:MAG: ABC transporter substrate-binding protein [Minwuia sp.]|uniref:ABC transporter substrate-binding protein n=1 Tax=Minwuia sp. TaxID=2493630 RepID=UPI003A8A9D50
MMTRRSVVSLVWAASAMLALPLAAAAQESGPVRIGEINSYDSYPNFTEPYRKGWQMALEEINASGGVLGQPLEVVSREDSGDPAKAAAAAEELIAQEKVHMLAGTYLSNVGLAVSKVARDKQVVFLATDPMTDRLVWSEGNRYTFRLRASTWMQAGMLAREAFDSEATKWATIAPDFEYGHDAVEAFKEHMLDRNPNIEFVSEQWVPLKGFEDPTPVVQALKQSGAEGIFNVLFGDEFVTFAREGNRLGLFKNKTNIGMLTGEPEYILPLGKDAPRGWIVTGYPWYDIGDPAHKKFVADYQARWNENPTMGSLLGYITLISARAAFEKAGTTKSELLLQALRGLDVATPAGNITYRKVDHQATLGSWVGITRWRESGGYLTGWRYVPGQNVLPPPDVAEAMRPDDSVN